MKSQFELKTQTYSITKLNLLSWGLVAAALGSAIASYYGSYPQSADLCFYPITAQERDKRIQDAEIENGIETVSNNSQKNLNKKLALGNKFCNVRNGDIGTIPKSYLVKAEKGSLNDQASELALVTQGLKEGWLYQLQEFPAENPFKLQFGYATIVLSGLALWTLNFTRDQMSLKRPKYRATHILASKQAGYSLAYADADSRMSAELMLVKLRGLREVESQEAFLDNTTKEQRDRLLGALSYEDYEAFGYLIDGGKSFHKFMTASVSEEVALEESAEFEPVVQASAVTSGNYDEDTQVVLDSKKPVEDNILFERIRNNKKGHLFIPCETGAGKTTMMLGAMRYLVKFGYKFSGSTTKLDAWGGLEKLTEDDGLPKVIRLSSDPEPEEVKLIEQLRDRLKWLMKLLRSRQQKEEELRLKGESYNPAPYVFILDEWLETLRIASRYDRLNRTQIKEDLIEYVNTFLSTARSAKIFIWVVAQDHQVQNASINTGLTKNLGFLVIGSHGTMVSIEGALVGSKPIIQDSTIRQQLWQQAQQLAAAHPKTSVSYSNVFCNEILLTPNLAGIEREIFFFDGKAQAKPETSKPADVWEDEIPVTQAKKVEFVNNEPQQLSLKQKVEMLIKSRNSYQKICATLWGDRPLEEIAPILGDCCRKDNIRILSECASYLLGVLQDLDWVDITSDGFNHLVDEELSDFQVRDGLEELRLLGYIQVQNANVKALY